MYGIGICGHFGNKQNLLNGQTIKTKILTEELEKKIGRDKISTIDTCGWKKNPIKLLYKCCLLTKECENIIILPAHKGVKVFVPLFAKLNKIFKRKLHYVVIGGWLPKVLKNQTKLLQELKEFEGIYVETHSMINALNNLGLNNVHYLPNFKRLNILKQDDLVYSHSEPYKLCTFSRVMMEKGIEDAISIVKNINNSFGRDIYTLDIYGQIEKEYNERFKEISKDFPSYISYKGLVKYDDSVDVIKEYFALLFPTKFRTEGIPGTIIDAYAAGVPVISSRWDSFDEIVSEGKTGLGYELEALDELESILIDVKEKPQLIINMKKNCIEEAKRYSADNVINELVNYF